MNTLITSHLLTKSTPPSFYVQVFSRVGAAWVGQIRESQKFKQHPNRKPTVPVYLLEDVEQLGVKGQIVWVKPGRSNLQLFPNKQAIPARIIDPYLRGPIYHILLHNKLGALAEERNLTLEQRREKSMKIVERILEEKVLRLYPEEKDFIIFPEDVSLSLRNIFKVHVSRECIGELLEEGKKWPVREFGDFSFNVQVDTGCVAVGRIHVEDPENAQEESDKK